MSPNASLTRDEPGMRNSVITMQNFVTVSHTVLACKGSQEILGTPDRKGRVAKSWKRPPFHLPRQINHCMSKHMGVSMGLPKIFGDVVPHSLSIGSVSVPYKHALPHR